MKKFFLFLLMLFGTCLSAETTIVISYNDYSCGWENYASAQTIENAYRLATNLAVYAARGRSTLNMAQVIHNGDWSCDPGAVENFVAGVESRVSLDITLAAAINPGTTVLDGLDLLIIFGHDAFSFDATGLANIKAFLDRGGVIFADDCNSAPNGTFATSWRNVIQSLYSVTFTNLDINNPLFRTHYMLSGNDASFSTTGYGTEWGQNVLQGVAVYTPQLEQGLEEWQSTPEPMSFVCLALGIFALSWKMRTK